MFFICLDTRAFWRSVCVTKFANPHGPSFWINAFQITERTIQPVQIDVMEIAAVVCGELGVKCEHHHSCPRDLKFLVYLNNIVATLGVFSIAYNTPPTRGYVFAVNHAVLVHTKRHTA